MEAEATRSILVVDDEEDVGPLFRQRFRREIRNGSARFLFARSGAVALELLEGAHADVVLILSDIRMPGMDGFELLEAIRERWPELPVHMVTAYDSQDHRDRASALGASGYVTKPVDFSRLRELMFNVIPPGAPPPGAREA